MSERPWMKFYPRDWRGDQALRVVSLAARGVWMECLCIMHEAKPYGHLLINGKPIGDDALARMVGAPADQVSAYMAELREAGVLSVTRNGVVFSRRMIKDDAAARKGAKAVAKRWEQASANKGKPKSPNREPIQEPITHIPEAREQKKEETDKSVSSPQAAFALSEPPSGKPRSTGQPGSRFPEFWAAYPKRSGNNSRKDAAARFDRIVKSGADPGMIIDGARRYAIWCDATGKTRTEFIQQAPTWLNANGWENDYAVTPGPTRPSGNAGFRDSRGEAVGNPRFASSVASASQRAARGREAPNAAGGIVDGDEDPDRWRGEFAGSNIIDATDHIRDRQSLRTAFAQDFEGFDGDSGRGRAGDVAGRPVQRW